MCVWWWGGGGGGVCVCVGGVGVVVCLNMTAWTDVYPMYAVLTLHHMSILTLLLPVQKPVVKCIFYLAYTVYYSWKITSDIFIRDDNHL